MNEKQAKALLKCLTHEEKLRLNEMLKAMEKSRFQLHQENGKED